MKTYHDITAAMGPLCPIPMYSFNTPAYLLWQAVFDGLQEAGMSEVEAIEWLQSKSARWAMDGELGDSIRALGHAYGKKEALRNHRVQV